MLSKLKQSSRFYAAMAFILPFGLFLTMMIIRDFIPFGNVSTLYSDSIHQYYPFFLTLRRAILSGESLLWNWEIGMGIDYLGLLAYYLASPLNLLSILVGESHMLAYFSLLPAIKLGFAGMFFAIFLQKYFHRNDFSVVLFGCFYALCAWALGYQWNIMWLDTFALLPLVILGESVLLSNGKFLLYTLSLCLSVLFNYYIGLFVCIYVALVFLCWEITNWDSWKHFFKDFLRILLYSLIAVGITAFLTLPAYAALQNTYSSSDSFPAVFQLNIVEKSTLLGLLGAMRQVASNINGGLLHTYQEGLPNLYCGVFCNIAIVLFLLCKQIKLRERLCALGLILFLMLSFVIRQLDFMWHGFHFPNMIPYRFSFLYSFTALYMAYRVYLLRRSFQFWQVITALLLGVLLCLCSDAAFNPNSSIVFWCYNGILLLLYGFALLLPCVVPGRAAGAKQLYLWAKSRRTRRRFSGIFLMVIFAMELGLNMLNFGANYVGLILDDFPLGTAHSASMIRYMKEKGDDEAFYRAEVTHSQILNESALNNYNGISAFTSSADADVTRFMNALGFAAQDSYNRYLFEEASPVSNLFLGLRFMLEREGHVEENPYFNALHHYGNVYLLENNTYLPLGFMAQEELADFDFSHAGQPFIFQNALLQAASGIQEDAWSLIPQKFLSVSSTTVEIQHSGEICQYTAPPNVGGTVVYKYLAHKDGVSCIYLDMQTCSRYAVWHNGVELVSDDYSLPGIVSAVQVEPGDIIEVHLTCYSGEAGSIRVQAAILDEPIFRSAYEELSKNTMDLTAFRNDFIMGSVSCDSPGLLYTSIPQNGNWVVYVDYKDAETIQVGDAMLGVYLDEGDHTVTFLYRNHAFSWGFIISAASIILLLILCKKHYFPRKKGS